MEKGLSVLKSDQLTALPMFRLTASHGANLSYVFAVPFKNPAINEWLVVDNDNGWFDFMDHDLFKNEYRPSNRESRKALKTYKEKRSLD